ncbi:MAG: helical backbone metal receptor [Gammaproteobacteria bacterium]|nr:helical backbone metal receptor [Gammaproteobacteria bacterium]
MRDAPVPVDAAGQVHERAAPAARIVSLVPSITELLFDLGLGAQVVGRTGFCIHPRDAVRAVPKLGGTKDVDLDALTALAPSHVIVNIDENTRETYDALRARGLSVVVTHPNAPADNLALYELLGAVFGREREAAALGEAFRTARTRLAAAARSLPPRRVLYLIWREPWMTVARDTYIANMLATVGWATVPAENALRYPALDDATLRATAPDLCLLSSEPYPFRDKHLAEVRALLGGQVPVLLIDGEMVSWYGSRAIRGLDYLASFATDCVASAA